MTEWDNRPAWHSQLQGIIGSFLGIGAVCYLTFVADITMLIASFGASAVLLYAVPNSPLAQPRNLLGGQVLSASIAVLVVYFIGMNWFSIALTVSLVIWAMTLTKTIHPPGGATAIIGVWTEQSFLFVLTPVMIGTLMLLVIAWLNNYLFSKKVYDYLAKSIAGGAKNEKDYNHGA